MAKQSKATKNEVQTALDAALKVWESDLDALASAESTNEQLTANSAAHTRELFSIAGPQGATALMEVLRDRVQHRAAAFIAAHPRPNPAEFNTESPQYKTWENSVKKAVHNPLRATDKVLRADHHKSLRVSMKGEARVIAYTPPDRTPATPEQQAAEAFKKAKKAIGECAASLEVATELLATMNKRFLGKFAFSMVQIAPVTPPAPPAPAPQPVAVANPLGLSDEQLGALRALLAAQGIK